MPIQVKCPNPECAQSLRAKDEFAGKTLRCPACKTVLKLPAPAGSTPAVTPAPVNRPVAAAAPASTPVPPGKKSLPDGAPRSPSAEREKVSTRPNAPAQEVPAPFDDFEDDLPPVKSKITDKPAAKGSVDLPKKGGKAKTDDFDDVEEVDTYTDAPPKKSGKGKKGDYDDYDDAPQKNGKAKKDDYDDDYDDRPKKGGKAKGKKKRDPVDDLPDTLWEDCDLFRHERLATKGKFSLWKNSFRILNPDTEEEVGTAEENLPTWKGWLRMFRIGPIVFANWLTIDVEIREEDKGPVLFYMRKLPTPMPWQLSSTIEILDFRKRRIGYFKTKLFSLSGGFWLYDDNDEQVAELKGKFSFTKPRMDFLDVNGDHLGDICMSIYDDKKKKKGFKLIFGNIPMVMTMKKSVRDHIPTKVLFLAATMATQLAYHRSGVKIG